MRIKIQTIEGATVPVYDGGRGMELHFCPECTERIIADSKEEGE